MRPDPRLLRAALLGAVLLGALAMPSRLRAQSSLFGVRGLGLPGRPLTAATRATEGSFGLFDPESDLNPGALAGLPSVVAGFGVTPTYRTWETPAGSANLRDTRFPLIYVAGPIPHSRVSLGVSVGSYADRDFRLATSTVLPLRGEQVTVNDTLSSLGGLSQIRVAGAYTLSSKTQIGGAFYFITGSSRIEAARGFSDSAFHAFRQTSELSYRGFGAAVGLTQLIGSALTFGVMVRSDGSVSVDQDSAHVYDIDLPWTFGAGLRLRASRRLTVAASSTYRTWRSADIELLTLGAPGSRNTLELAFGGEYIRNLRSPNDLPIRFGIRYADLPFPVVTGAKPREIDASLGTGKWFAQDRAGLDIAIEEAWRHEGSAYKERAFSISFGLSIRPYGPTAR
ncbi:MAG TPA: hypothetical protein VMG41_16130 [Gemmatimonadales bacterium]|nr:hypothetical protein [Gemmatimonadales bacterium]